MARCMYRHRVIVNGLPQKIGLGGDPLHVEAARVWVGADAQHAVDFWAESAGEGAAVRTFQVFGTGHPLPDGARYWGPTARTSEGLVWHLYELQG